MGEKMGERISPPNTWKHTTENYHQVGIAHLVLKRKPIILIFVRHLQLRLGII
jgi:hypothetical protein